MEKIMENLSQLIESVNNCLWGPPMILLLSGTHLFMTWKTGFIQKKLPLAIRLSLTRDPDSEGDISPFAALSTSLASTLGTGNIIGVGTAIALGGPGAVFWCWLTGIFGIATSYAESLIALKYRIRAKDGTMLGGAMYALERGLHLKPLAVLFAFFGALTSFGIGCGVQVNAISAVAEPALREAAGSFPGLSSLMQRFPQLPALAIGLVTGLVTCAVIFGGVRSVSRVCERLVPFMALFYMLGCLAILYINRAFLADALALILKSAFFETGSLAGGMAGSGIMLAARYGISRGLFSNEAGSGSAPCAAAAAETDHPAKAGLAQALGVFIDTIVICSCTAMVMLLAPQEVTAGLSGMELLQAAMSYHLGSFGVIFIALILWLFSFSTFIGILFYARSNVAYLFGDNWISQTAYKVLALVMLFIGGLASYSFVWDLGDVGIALMTVFNLAFLFPLSSRALASLRDYEQNFRRRT